MRLLKSIAWLTLVTWAVQTLGFVAFFGSSFAHLIVRCFVSVGVAIPETSLETFFSDVMKILSWPIRPLFAATWAEGSVVTILLLLALNSLIWGVVLGTFLFLATRNRRSSAGPHQ